MSTVAEMTREELTELVRQIVRSEVHALSRLTIEDQLAHLPADERTLALREYVARMIEPNLPPNYDPNHDPAIGMFDFGADFASSAREILQARDAKHGSDQ
jgi:hypothetical protein